MTTLSVANMEEREALKREIEVLQDLIDNHKRIHGDNPFTRVPLPEAQRSSRGFGPLVGHSYCSRGRIYPPENRGSWKRKYSLRNKNPQSSSARPFIASSSSSSSELPASTSLSSDHRGEKSVKTPALSPSSSLQSPSNVTQMTTGTINTTNTMPHKIHHRKIDRSQQMAESRRVVPAESKTVPAVVQTNASLSLPSLVSITDSKRTDTVAVSADLTNTTVTAPTAAAAVAKLSKQASSNPPTHSNHHQTSKPGSANSKFVWVKTQTELQKSSRVPTPAGKTGNDFPSSTSGAESNVVHSACKKTPAKKPPQKTTQDRLSTKSSKYKWVSSTASQAKVSRKSPSPKVQPPPQKALETGGLPKRGKAAPTSPTTSKKEVATSSRSSRYSWKAAATGGTVVRRRSSFYWTPDKRNKGVRGGFSPGALRTSLPSSSSSPSPSSSSSPGAFKLRSRMKIIRSGSEKVSSTSGVKFSTPGRSSAAIRGPAGARRTSSRELVSFGRHKLRRLCTSFARTSPSSSSSSSLLQEFGSPRYRARLGPSASHTHHYNPAVSWRAKKIQSARSFLQSRLRAHHYRHPPSSRQWPGSSVCWIRGSLYRVSANKLSRTVASSPASSRTGKTFGSAQSSAMAWNRASSTRHLASRAVQRSLAIIRHARQKKQLKQYCMYYNRFGKCNRGNSCPYIHDPDKVAVCTRFLRGTCKKAEGICPFSHKVAKEKMPVCSYFLKGICNNNDCPYSHVYVSHKAKVCEDFVKGYCPEGEKCKKKHTLVCPDFSKMGSCPRGARCKLQHRQRAKRTSASTAATPAKRARSSEPASSRQDPQAAAGTPAGGPLELPSYISLCSSPEEADAADTQPEDASRGKEKKLQIKPRLRDARERPEEEPGAAGLS